MVQHDWILVCLIQIIEYSEREGLHDVSKILNRSVSRIAPSLKEAAKPKGAAESVVIPFRNVVGRKGVG